MTDTSMTSDPVVAALQEAIYEVSHLSAPRPDDTEPLYRPIIRKSVVDGWRAALKARARQSDREG